MLPRRIPIRLTSDRVIPRNQFEVFFARHGDCRAAMYARQLGPMFLERKAIPFSVLQHSFTRFSPTQAEIAYAESLSASEYLRDRYGMFEIRRMLQSIGSGVESETALANSKGMDYATLAERIGEQMSKQ